MSDRDSASAVFPGRLALQQRVLPTYRAPFLEALATACSGGLYVFTGQPRPEENTPTAEALAGAEWTQGRNRQPFGPANPLFFLQQPELLAWLERTDPDALIVEANPRYLSTPEAVAWMHARGRPVLGWGLGASSTNGAHGVGRLLAQALARRRADFLGTLDGVIAYSQRGAESYRAAGLAPGRVFVAPNAAAPRPSRPLPERSSASGGDPLTVIFVGRLQARKRLDVLLTACASLPPDCQPRLWIVGEGPARAALTDLAAQVYPAARFWGAQWGGELSALLDAADLFVLPGTGGLAVQQAMAHGLPVIVAQGDGTQGDLVRPETGWLLPSDERLPAELAATLFQALSDLPGLRRRGAASFHIVRDEINLETMTASFLAALAQVGGGAAGV
jgi:glycosyltransferase involved in cell wall biosynthesis